MADAMPTAAQNVRTQLGIEVTWGTEVDATLALGSVRVTDGIDTENEVFKASGSKLANAVIHGMEIGKHTFDGKATFEETAYLIPDLAIDAASAISPKYTMERGIVGAANALTYPGTIITNWTLKGNTKSVDISGGLLSKTYNTNALTGSIDIPAVTPIENAHITISIGGSNVTDALEWEMSVQNLWALAQFIGSASAGGANEGNISGTFSLLVEANGTNIGKIATPRTSQALIITANNGTHTVVVKANIRFKNADSFSAAGEVYAVKLNYELMNEEVGVTGNIIDVTTT